MLAPRSLKRADGARRLRSACQQSKGCTAALSDVSNVCQSLGRMKALVEARRLRWLPELTAEHEISDDGRTLTCTRSAGSDDLLPWVSGGLLPNQGKSAWKVRVLRSLRNDGNGMFVGVCDATSCWAWGLFLFSGRLRRVT